MDLFKILNKASLILECSPQSKNKNFILEKMLKLGFSAAHLHLIM